MANLPEDALIDSLAIRLRNAYRAYEPIAPIRNELASGGVEAAYAVQLRNTAHWLVEGRRAIGRKIGITSEAVQRQLGVDQPDFGTLFDDMRLSDGEAVPLRFVLQPRIEAEVAIVLGRRIASPVASYAEVEAAIDHLLPALEVVGSRIAGWDISLLDTIADNASSGMLVLGTTPVSPKGIDLAAAGMTLQVDGQLVSQGSGAACLGHPYNAALWLARRMALEGTPLEAGDIVMTGALGPMVDLRPGARAVAQIEGLGSVRVYREEGNA